MVKNNIWLRVTIETNITKMLDLIGLDVFYYNYVHMNHRDTPFKALESILKLYDVNDVTDVSGVIKPKGLVYGCWCTGVWVYVCLKARK